MKRLLKIYTLITISCLISSCSFFTSNRPSPAEVKAWQQQNFAVSTNRLYPAILASLQSLGYSITAHSYEEGFIEASGPGTTTSKQVALGPKPQGVGVSIGLHSGKVAPQERNVNYIAIIQYPVVRCYLEKTDAGHTHLKLLLDHYRVENSSVSGPSSSHYPILKQKAYQKIFKKINQQLSDSTLSKQGDNL